MRKKCNIPKKIFTVVMKSVMISLK